jgi:signal transduction histidine kinase/ligand-binding sensor domain-containing protein/CheY-like chemotaxis protein
MPIRALLCVCASASLAYALDPSKAITQYRQWVWTTDNGLPQNTVTAITQTDDGYIWLGTEEGLARFDGLRFVLFNEENTPLISNNTIGAMAAEPGGGFWALTLAGLLHYSGRSFETIGPAAGLPTLKLNAILRDPAGTLWITTEDHGLLHYVAGAFETKHLASQGREPALRAVARQENGVLWVASNQGLIRFANNRATWFTARDGLPDSDILSVAIAPDQSVWCGTRKGHVVHLRGGKFEAVRSAGMPSNPIRQMLFDRDGNLWLIFEGAGVGRLHSGKFTPYRASAGLPDDDAASLFESAGGELWIGESSAGVVELADPRAWNWGLPEGLRAPLVWAVAQGRDDAIWFTNGRGGIGRLVKGRVKMYPSAGGASKVNAISLLVDRSGEIWSGGDHGLVYHIANGKFESFKLPGSSGQWPISSIIQDHSGVIWFGSFDGLTRYDHGAVRRFTAKDGLASSLVASLLVARDGSLWIGCRGGLSHLAGGRFENYRRADGLRGDTVSGMYEDSSGSLWLAMSSGGLQRLKDGHIASIDLRNGLWTHSINAIIDDGRGDFWLTSNSGIARIPERELNAVAGTNRVLPSYEFFGRQDGIRNPECSGEVTTAGICARDGRLWFPTVKGLVTIDVDHLPPFPPLAPVVLEQIVADGKNLPPDAAATLRAGHGEFEITYTVPNFANPAGIRFRYRLTGADSDWVYAGERRTAHYASLAPGDYRFEVEAESVPGAWTPPLRAFLFRVPPLFYQTGWFLALCLAGAAACLGAGYLYRTRALRSRNTELERRVAERTAQMTQAMRAAEAAAAAKGEFLANMSHEIRTPINAVVALADLLLSCNLDAEAREYAETIRNGARTLISIINNILDFSKIESRRIDLEHRPLDLRRCVSGAMSLARIEAERKGLRLESKFAPGTPEKLLGDPTRLGQILLNLLSNAVKFTHQGSVTVSVSSTRPHPMAPVRLQVEVADTGIGIPEDRRDRLFQSFSQLDSSTTRRYGGTGLGLAITKRLIERMGGRIDVMDTPGGGATFRFFVLLDAPPEEALAETPPQQAAAPPSTPNGSALRVLVAEDNPINRKVAAHLLSKLGHSYTTAENGLLALSSVLNAPTDVVLMDLQMPEMDGLEATRRIRASLPAAQQPWIVALTASAFEHTRSECLQAGMNDFLSKPITLDALRAALSRASSGEELVSGPGASKP